MELPPSNPPSQPVPPTEGQLPSQRPRRKLLLTALALAVFVPLAVLLFLWFGIPPRVPTGPVHLARDGQGRLVREDHGAPPARLWAEFHAGRLNSRSTFGSSASSVHSENDQFACQRLLILNASDHLLMARVGSVLLEELGKASCVREVDYYPAGFRPPPGGLKPDLVLRLDAESIAESSMLVSQTVEARLLITVANTPPGCNYHPTDLLTPAGKKFDWHGALHHTSTTRGVASSAARYKQVAESIGREIGQRIAKELQEQFQKAGNMPDLPAVCFPAYRRPPALPLEGLGELTMECSWHGLQCYNETLWRLDLSRPSGEVLDEIQRRCRQAGWQVSDSSLKGAQPYLSMSRDAARLMAYVPKPEASDASATPPIPPMLRVHYVDRMNEAELRSVVDTLLAQHCSPETLFLVQRHWSEKQSRQIVKSLEAVAPRTPQRALALAKLYRRLKQDDNARAMLVKVNALLQTVGDYSDLQNKSRELAKELKDEKLADRPVEPRTLLELGFRELKPGTEIPPQPIGPDEPVHLFYRVPEKGKTPAALKTLSLRVAQNPGGAAINGKQLEFVQSSQQARSWGSGGNSRSFSLDDKLSVQATLQPPAADGKHRLAIRVN